MQTKEYFQEYYKKNKEKLVKYQRKYHQKWRVKNKKHLDDYNSVYQREYYKKNKVKRSKYEKEYNKKFPERRKAKDNVRWYMEKGIIIKPKECEICHKEKILDAHHYKGYERKNWLKVKFLCKSCHKKEHASK